MLRTALLGLFLVLGYAFQVPIMPSGHGEENPEADLNGPEVGKWDIDEIPNPNDTDHLVFGTVYSLLQYWPNTHIGNGHNIVPGIVPEGTLLFHGTNHEYIPQGPEWVALDPEHAYYYCVEQAASGFTQQPGCWQLTLITTRPLKVIYFDGASASKHPDGQMDTQDLLVWGESIPEAGMHEQQRSRGLCRWGKKFGVDGFVRMAMAFEVILCDFTSGVSVVSFANIVSGLGLPPDISASSVLFETFNAGVRHAHFPGETRVQLDLTKLVSFYDTQLVPSLVAVRAGQERREHRMRDISKEDLSAAMSRLEAALIRPSGPSSGIDWKTHVQVLVDLYTRRLELMQDLLNSTITHPPEILDATIKTQTQLRIMLAPYLHLSAVPTGPSDETALGWAAPVYKDCSTIRTNYVKSRLDSMTSSERLLLRAVQGTNREICRVLTKMWVAGVYAGIDPSINTKEAVEIGAVTQVRNTWVKDLNGLMSWLDWGMWIKCKPGCGPKEVCFLQRWPVVLPRRPRLGAGMAIIPWVPQPKCLSLVNP